METIVTVNSVPTANGFELIPLSLSIYFGGSTHTEHFPATIVC